MHGALEPHDADQSLSTSSFVVSCPADHSGAADGRCCGGGGDRGPGALGEPARQLGAHLHAVPRLLPAHQRRRRGILPRRARPLIPRHLGRLRHQETLNWMISALMCLHAYVLAVAVCCVVLCDFSCGMRYTPTCVSVREEWRVERKCLCTILRFIPCKRKGGQSVLENVYLSSD